MRYNDLLTFKLTIVISVKTVMLKKHMFMLNKENTSVKSTFTIDTHLCTKTLLTNFTSNHKHTHTQQNIQISDF